MIDQTAGPLAPPPSPLDPFLAPFLHQIEEHRDGYAPASHASAVAAALDWPPAFADALFTSARARGMLEPLRTRGARGRNRWCVSARGTTWLLTVVGEPDLGAAVDDGLLFGSAPLDRQDP